MFYLGDLDHPVHHESLIDPLITDTVTRRSRLAAKRAELNQAIKERRDQRRADRRNTNEPQVRPVTQTV